LHNRKKNIVILTITALIVIVIDQITKYIIRTTPSLHNFDIIKGWLAFHYTQNPGMAMGINIVPTPVISVISLLAIIGIIIYTVKLSVRANVGQMICMGLIVGGAVGNIIDRMFMAIIQSYGGFMQGHVVDFIFFTLKIDGHTVFPYIFNFADACITTSILILIVFSKYLLPSGSLKAEETVPEKGTVGDGNDNKDLLATGTDGVNPISKSE